MPLKQRNHQRNHQNSYNQEQAISVGKMYSLIISKVSTLAHNRLVVYPIIRICRKPKAISGTFRFKQTTLSRIKYQDYLFLRKQIKVSESGLGLLDKPPIRSVFCLCSKHIYQASKRAPSYKGDFFLFGIQIFPS